MFRNTVERLELNLINSIKLVSERTWPSLTTLDLEICQALRKEIKIDKVESQVAPAEEADYIASNNQA